MRSETIVAVTTPAGVGGIAVVRLSGTEALSIALRHLSVKELSPRKATYCHFGALDDVIAVYYPTGYTGEPTVEISCHGSLYVQQAVVETLVDAGARMAEAGEFTMRAFVNGRMDLSQAEAVADLVDAVTPAQHRLAVSQLRGGYAKVLKELRQQLLDLTSLLELEFDFSQEDVEFADRSQLSRIVDDIGSKISALRSTFHLGNALKRGIPTAIIGRPNAGKSSLLNALLADNRAIVSPIAGTTRDTIEETFNIDGVTFRLIDTAGLHHTDDLLENMGIDRAIAAAVEADIILYVHDATRPWTEAVEDLQALQDAGVKLGDKHLWVVLNKFDLPEAIEASRKLGIAVSSLKGTGLDALRELMLKAVTADVDSASQTLLTNARHYDALGRTNDALLQVAQGLKEGIPSDLLAVDLRDALYHLGTITGEVANNEVLGNIFSRFCVGK
ncbi:MAG: tRNA uridine-5-carboxymethylaminomethyl(34) synthesis GTPase MnmE [Bacteroidales bacterium]|nr:tRNA uridine-5-carboxymethylaminomethyl(34) synthesis GTPase MnmE [Bacteroidales bacterium]